MLVDVSLRFVFGDALFLSEIWGTCLACAYFLIKFSLFISLVIRVGIVIIGGGRSAGVFGFGCGGDKLGVVFLVERMLEELLS